MNYSNLQKNTLDGFSETAGILYMKLCDVFCGDERRAFFAACEYETKTGGVIGHILENYPIYTIDSKAKTDLSQFLSERWRNNFMGKDNGGKTQAQG